MKTKKNKEEDVLKIIPVNNADGEKLIESLKDTVGGYSHRGFLYLHGRLESENGYDFVKVINFAKEHGKKTFNWGKVRGSEVESLTNDKRPYRTELYINGEVDVSVLGFENRKCKGFFWTIKESELTYQGETLPFWEQLGLICFADDIEACEDARKKMNSREEFI